MHLVLRVTRLPAPRLPEIYYYIQRQQQCSIHLFAPLRCQPKLKVSSNHSNPNSGGKIDPTAADGKLKHRSSATSTGFGPNFEFLSSKSKLGDPELPPPTPTPPPSSSSSSSKCGRRKDDSDDDCLIPPPPPPNPHKPKSSRETVRENVRGYVFTRYFDYVKNYDKVLEKNFPAAFKLYRVFFDGLRDFYADMKRYVKVWRIANSSEQGLRALNRKELELFMQMPRDMVKVAPALIGTSLPLIGYAFFPIVFMYPRRFLTSHFWTLQQRIEFQQMQLQERFSHNRTVFRCLQSKLKSLRHQKEKHDELDKLLGLIGSGFHPSVQAIVNIKDIFSSAPYSLESLSGKHIKHLVEMHGLPGGLSKRFRLKEHAYLVHHMDLAIGREGGAHNVPLDSIEKCCAIRGLNPANMSKEDMVVYLRNWIQVSTSIKEDHISLFLHLPIFLGYNHPNNWKLIYKPNSQTK